MMPHPHPRPLRQWLPALALVVLTLLLLFAVPSASAQSPRGGDRDGLVVYLGEPAYVAADRQVVALAVFGADARVDGTVRNTLFVVDGRAEVAGAVHGDVVVVDGALALGPGALVTGDVTLYGSALERAGGAEVVGAVREDAAVEVGRAAALFWWASGTLAFVALALGVVGLFGARPGPAREALRAPGRSLLVGIGLVLAVPALAVMAFMTGVGLGVGLLLLAALPGLLVAGYIVGGVAIGAAGAARLRPSWAGRPWVPYAAAALGVVALQVAWVVPVLGLLVPLAAAAGAGGLALHAVAARRQRRSLSGEADPYGGRSAGPDGGVHGDGAADLTVPPALTHS